MKITDVTLTLFKWEGLPILQYSPANPVITGTSQLGLLRIETDAGVTGESFLGASMRGAQVDCWSLMQFLKPVVMARDPFDREAIYHDLMRRQRATTLRAIGAVDVALWDLAGKVAGLPLHRLMGACRDSIPAYASSPGLPSPQAYADQALEMKEKGLAGYKIHPPTRWRDDIAVCEAVRRAVGDDYLLMLDSTWAYRYEEALRVGRAIEEMDYYWYEDPLGAEDIYGYVKLREKLDIPIMATEYSPGGFGSFAAWIEAKATDFLRGDVAVKGGLTGCYKAAILAQGFGMNFEIHHGGNSLNNVANLHLAMAIPNCEFFEVLLPDEAQKYGLVQDIEVGADGLVRIDPFNKPGLGAEIDYALIEANKVDTLT
jgi:L-alanine-DL-glutamate epimerase-like enolase superfamily enzyme